MRIAVLARMCANLPAVEAVLDDLMAQKHDALWCVGDWVTYGPHPEAVIARLRPLCTLGVVGAGDLSVLRCADMDGKAEEAFSSACWSYHQLSKENRRYLRLLSTSLRFKLEGRRFLLTQGAGLGDEGELSPALPAEAWLRLFQKLQTDVLVISSGAPGFVYRLGEVLCINVGAVGNAEKASYALVELTDGLVQVGFRDVPYPVHTVWETCREQGLPEFPPYEDALPVDAIEANHSHGENDEAETLLDRRLLPVLELARARGDGDEAHLFTVSRLALQLFDQLQPMHHLGREERFWLECAALLHTLERPRHPRSYPRRALQTILNTPLLPFETRERLLIGSLVRYQRQRPRKKHQNYALLKAGERSAVQTLSALLRLALALAESEVSVEDLYGSITPRKLKLQLITRVPADELCRLARKRGKRLAHLYGRKLRVSYLLLEEPPAGNETEAAGSEP